MGVEAEQEGWVRGSSPAGGPWRERRQDDGAAGAAGMRMPLPGQQQGCRRRRLAPLAWLTLPWKPPAAHHMSTPRWHPPARPPTHPTHRMYGAQIRFGVKLPAAWQHLGAQRRRRLADPILHRGAAGAAAGAPSARLQGAEAGRVARLGGAAAAHVLGGELGM